MPDHPDDAPKKQQRGVLPPFFAPRSGGRGEAPPAPASGSWRRVSRLFTPPDVARQRGSSAGPLRPFTPPSTPTAEPPAASELLPPPGGPELPTDRAMQLETPAVTPETTPVVSPVAASFPFDIAETAEALTLDEIAWPTPTPSEVVEGDRFVGSDPGGSDAMGDADLVVESLEPVPISLAIPGPATAGAGAGAGSEVWAIEHTPLDTFSERADVAHATSIEAFDAGEDDAPPAAYDGVLDAVRPEAVDAAVPEYGSLSREDDSWGAGNSPFMDDSWDGSDAAPAVEEYASWGEPTAPAALESPASAHDLPPLEDDLPVPSDELEEVAPAELSLPNGVTDTAAAAEVVESEADPAAEVTSEAPAASDPWADVDLSEPTFGSGGWPQAYGADAGSTDWPTVEAVADVASPISDEPSVERIDPLRAAAQSEITAESESVDEMSAALAWNESEAEDSPAAAAFGTGGSTAAAGEDTLSSVAHELRGISSSWAPAATSAAIADALARVAERIRAGEVELSVETAGASDESALAAALAALLRGPRQR